MFIVYVLFYLRTYPFGSMAGLEEGTEEGTRTSTAMEVETAKPTCVIVLGMAGSGKTTFVQVRRILESLIKVIIFILENNVISSRAQVSSVCR